MVCEESLAGDQGPRGYMLEQSQCKSPIAGMCQETARRQVWGPSGPSQESLSKIERINYSILMLAKYRKDPGFNKVEITGDLEESSFVGLVRLEKVLERMEKLDLMSIDTSCAAVYLKGKENMRQ